MYPEVRGLFDLDLSFTPATNYFQTESTRDRGRCSGRRARRVVRATGVGKLTRVEQLYERLRTRLPYVSFRSGYDAVQQFAPSFARLYPELWELEPAG